MGKRRVELVILRFFKEYLNRNTGASESALLFAVIFLALKWILKLRRTSYS